MAERVWAAALLVVALLPMATLFRRRVPRFRGAHYQRHLAARSWLRFGPVTALVLLLLGRVETLWRLPAEFASATTVLGVDRFGPGDRRALALSCAGGVAIGTALLLGITAWRAWRGRPEGTTFGDARALVPQDPRDYGWAAFTALGAGVTEEAYFRLLLPLLAAMVTGSAIAGFAGATLLFGAAHRYQGWRGVLATGVAGAALAIGYLATGSLLVMMAVHAAGDLGHLVLRPALRRWVERTLSRVPKGA